MSYEFKVIQSKLQRFSKSIAQVLLSGYNRFNSEGEKVKNGIGLSDAILLCRLSAAVCDNLVGRVDENAG